MDKSRLSLPVGDLLATSSTADRSGSGNASSSSSGSSSGGGGGGSGSGAESGSSSGGNGGGGGGLLQVGNFYSSNNGGAMTRGCQGDRCNQSKQQLPETRLVTLPFTLLAYTAVTKNVMVL